VLCGAEVKNLLLLQWVEIVSGAKLNANYRIYYFAYKIVLAYYCINTIM